ncbi:hypothetical protein K443DRAFT_682656 [Laccaria amethystina LaAM-08-1]|uniref:Uncharacterized protein n=1 Tax=Laccaria amethystina LaAM-08-1 TaxID=1095629 RepID=A0A0C9WUJ7_9AGAR|nr:hypothetical protein K443DRAFT_682656 [Laccaria amethystina LaAM-08-1]
MMAFISSPALPQGAGHIRPKLMLCGNAPLKPVDGGCDGLSTSPQTPAPRHKTTHTVTVASEMVSLKVRGPRVRSTNSVTKSDNNLLKLNSQLPQ